MYDGALFCLNVSPKELQMKKFPRVLRDLESKAPQTCPGMGGFREAPRLTEWEGVKVSGLQAECSRAGRKAR